MDNARLIAEGYRDPHHPCGYELVGLACALAAETALWQPVSDAADGTHRHWLQLLDLPDLDAYAISWLDQQTTGFHDHCRSHFGVSCAQGVVVEERPHLPRGEISQHTLPVGAATQGRDGVIHLIRYGAGSPAITIHCYAPKLLRVGRYLPDRRGGWVRLEQDGHEELVEGALPC